MVKREKYYLPNWFLVSGSKILFDLFCTENKSNNSRFCLFLSLLPVILSESHQTRENKNQIPGEMNKEKICSSDIIFYYNSIM